jgi:hypothetical protein
MGKLESRKLVTGTAVAAFGTAVNAASVAPPAEDEELVPTGKGWGERPVDGRGHVRRGPAGS